MDAVYLYNNGTKSLLASTASEDHPIVYHKLGLKLGECGGMELKLLSSDSNLDYIKPLVSEISFERNGVELFRGEAVIPENDGLMSDTITINGALNYLGRVLIPPHNFRGTIDGYVRYVLNVYNNGVDQYHKIQPGIVKINNYDDTESVQKWSNDYEYALDLLKDRLVNTLGGFLRIRVVNGTKYLDYINTTEVVSRQSVEYGKNLISTAQAVDYQDVYSVFIPLGAEQQENEDDSVEDEDDVEEEQVGICKKLTIESVNNGSIYLIDQNALAKYGRREKVLEFDDVTIPYYLKQIAQISMLQYTTPVRNIIIKAVDEAVYNSNATSWNLGDSVSCPIPIYNKSSGKIEYERVEMVLTERDIYALNPEDEILSFGTVKSTLSDRIAGSVNRLKKRSEELQKALDEAEAKRKKKDQEVSEAIEEIETSVENAEEKADQAYITVTELEEILGRIAKLEEDDEGGTPNWNIVAFNKNVREYKNCIVIGYGTYNLDISEGPYTLDRCTLIGGTFKTDAITGSETKPMFALKTRATVIGARFEANSRDKYPAIFEENRTKIANGTVKVPDYVTLSGTSSNINAFWIGEYNNITIQDCYFNNVIPARINGAKGLRIINNRIMNAPMVVWASNANLHFGGNHVTIPSDCPTYFYHIYYLSNETICHAFNNDVTMNSSDGHYLWSIYHLMTAGDTSTTQEIYDTGSIYRGSFNHITDSRYSRMFMNGCDYRNCMNTMSSNGQHLNIEFDCCNFTKLNGVAREAGTDRTDAKHRFVNCEINAPNELPAYCEYKNCYIKSTGAHDMLFYNNTDFHNSRFLISGTLKRLFVISSANVSSRIVGNFFEFKTRNSDGGGLIRCNTFSGCATFNTVTGANESSNAMVQATTSADSVVCNVINGTQI